MIGLYGLAIFYRNNSAKHVRSMIVMVLMFLRPTFGRIGPVLLGLSDFATQNIEYAIIFSILGALILYDRSNGKGFNAYLMSVSFYMGHMLVYYLIFAL